MKDRITLPPDFSGLDPETGEPWSPRKVASLLGLRAMNDESEIRSVCERVVRAHPEQAGSFRKGKQGLVGFFVKKVMDETKSGADPVVTDRILREILSA